MEWSRRRTLQVAGASISGTIVAGCLSTTDPGSTDPPEGDGDPAGGGDADDLSIDGRLHNDAPDARTFEVTIRAEDDEVVASEEWEVEAQGTLTVPAFGRPDEPRTFEVTVDGVTATESLALDVEPTPGKKTGYVDIRYTDEGTVEIAFTPTDESSGGGKLPRVDEPPYEISELECGDEGDRDPLWLCENMAAEPSLEFVLVETSSSILANEGLQLEEDQEGQPQFYAVLLTDVDDLDRVDEDAGGDASELIEGTDFETEAVLVVQTGWGSGSETPHLKRIEETDTGVHAFGCYRQPCMWTDDYTMRTVVARFERPGELDEGFVSLTVDSGHRVNVEAGEGVVTVRGRAVA